MNLPVLVALHALRKSRGTCAHADGVRESERVRPKKHRERVENKGGRERRESHAVAHARPVV